jgi:hypothetical protein
MEASFIKTQEALDDTDDTVIETAKYKGGLLFLKNEGSDAIYYNYGEQASATYGSKIAAGNTDPIVPGRALHIIGASTNSIFSLILVDGEDDGQDTFRLLSMMRFPSAGAASSAGGLGGYSRIKEDIAQSIPNVAWTQLTELVPDEESGTDVAWDAANNKWEIATSGLYLVLGHVHYDQAGSLTGLRILQNAVVLDEQLMNLSGVQGNVRYHGIWHFDAGDDITIDTYQNTGAAKNASTTYTRLTCLLLKAD